MKKILLMGNPNVGKSVVFARLTGAKVIASNYPGTTVDFYKGKIKIGEEIYELIDAPGTYSLEPSNKAEEVAKKLLEEADIVINVVDATNLERNLYLTLQLLETKKPMIVALNLWDEAKHLGIKIDVEKLENELGVPVVPTVALTGEGIKKLVERIKEAKGGNLKLEEAQRWAKIGEIVKKVEKISHRHHTWKDWLAEITIKPLTGVPIAIIILAFCFVIVRFIGEGIANLISPLFDAYLPLLQRLADFLGDNILRDILVGQLIDGKVSFEESMGLLSTALYVPFGVVLPYIIAFYVVLSILEDTGYLPRLATLTDNIFHRLGMHGYGIITVFLGLGCNVPGAMATRSLETRKQRFISATLLAIAVPCMAQIAMIFGALGAYGMKYIAMVFITLAILYFIMGLILNRFVKGESPEIFMEIPPYRKPSLTAIAKKTWMRIQWFLRDAIPWLFFGVFIINILYALHILDFIGNLLSPIIVGWFGLKREAAVALIAGFLRKDLAVGMLLPLQMTAKQLVIAITILAIYFPCVATFTTLMKELGLKDMFKATLIMLFTAFVVGGLQRILLLGI
ncbi:MAG TPA: ferrous iron transporter B [Thermoplasmatales archaeon]|nr:ferrous iron transporter B [Thermoplasmatales archaeon]